MATGKQGSWAFAEEFLDDDSLYPGTGALATARERGQELGCTPVLPGTGSALRTIAAMSRPRSVVEIGAGAGVGSLYLLDGMPRGAVLTAIDPEMENLRAAKEAYADAGIRAQRIRTIAGRPLDVLGRLTDAAYDLVVVPAADRDAAAHVDEALRLLRDGGVLALANVLWHDRIADPGATDAVTRRVRELVVRLQTRDDLVSSLLTAGDGLLVSVVRRG
jgi:predicted O-methyltransferase YrrM